MIRNGRWVITRPWIERVAGFHINELYSPVVDVGKHCRELPRGEKAPRDVAGVGQHLARGDLGGGRGNRR